MRRSGPIPRKTPLQNRSQMDRGRGLAQGTPLARSGPVKPRRDTPRRRSREDVEHGMAWPDVRLVIWLRAGGGCERCGKPLTLQQMQGHHRRTRRVGPDCPCNALSLCSACHHGPEGHGGPARAGELGVILSRHSASPPAEEPVELHGGTRVLLTCDGTYAAEIFWQ